MHKYIANVHLNMQKFVLPGVHCWEPEHGMYVCDYICNSKLWANEPISIKPIVNHWPLISYCVDTTFQIWKAYELFSQLEKKKKIAA